MIKKFLIRTIIGTVIASIFLCVIIPIILDHFVFGNNIPSSLGNAEWSSFLGSYLGGIIGGIATLLAVVISLNINTKIQRDAELRENALIVYYDLILGLVSIKKLYINYKNPNFKNVPLRIFFSNEWIKNVSKAFDDIQYIDNMYNFYRDLGTIDGQIQNRNELDIYKGIDIELNDEGYGEFINKAAKKIFSNEFLNSDVEIYSSNEDVELDIDRDLNDNFGEIVKFLEHIKRKL